MADEDRRRIIDRANQMLRQSTTLRKMANQLLKESDNLRKESKDLQVRIRRFGVQQGEARGRPSRGSSSRTKK